MKQFLLILLAVTIHISGCSMLLLILASVVYIVRKKQFDLNAKEEMAKFKQISVSDSDKKLWGYFQKKHGNLLRFIKDNEVLEIVEIEKNKYKLIKKEVFLAFKYDSVILPLGGIYA